MFYSFFSNNLIKIDGKKYEFCRLANLNFKSAEKQKEIANKINFKRMQMILGNSVICLFTGSPLVEISV